MVKGERMRDRPTLFVPFVMANGRALGCGRTLKTEIPDAQALECGGSKEFLTVTGPGGLRPGGSQMRPPPCESSSSFLELGSNLLCEQKNKRVIRDRKRPRKRHPDVGGEERRTALPKLCHSVVRVGKMKRRARLGAGMLGRGHAAALETAGTIIFETPVTYSEWEAFEKRFPARETREQAKVNSK